MRRFGGSAVTSQWEKLDSLSQVSSFVLFFGRSAPYSKDESGGWQAVSRLTEYVGFLFLVSWLGGKQRVAPCCPHKGYLLNQWTMGQWWCKLTGRGKSKKAWLSKSFPPHREEVRDPRGSFGVIKTSVSDHVIAARSGIGTGNAVTCQSAGGSHDGGLQIQIQIRHILKHKQMESDTMCSRLRRCLDWSIASDTRLN